MGLPRIIYNPGGGNRNLDFPEELSDEVGEGRIPARQVNETQGGVFGVQFEHFKEDLEPVIYKIQDSGSAVLTFRDECVPFWSWAGRGGAFAYAEDRDDAVQQLVRLSAPATSTRIAVDSSTPFQVGQRYVIESIQNGYARENFQVTAKDVGSPPSIDIDRNLIYSYVPDDIVRSIRFFPKCVAIGNTFPLKKLVGNTLQWRLRFQTYRDITVA